MIWFFFLLVLFSSFLSIYLYYCVVKHHRNHFSRYIFRLLWCTQSTQSVRQVFSFRNLHLFRFCHRLLFHRLILMTQSNFSCLLIEITNRWIKWCLVLGGWRIKKWFGFLLFMRFHFCRFKNVKISVLKSLWTQHKNPNNNRWWL